MQLFCCHIFIRYRRLYSRVALPKNWKILLVKVVVRPCHSNKWKRLTKYLNYLKSKLVIRCRHHHHRKVSFREFHHCLCHTHLSNSHFVCTFSDSNHLLDASIDLGVDALMARMKNLSEQNAECSEDELSNRFRNVEQPVC